MASRFLEQLARRVLVFDGAMGTSIYDRDLDLERDYCGCENCTDILVRTRPDVIQEIHESFLIAGADCVETDTFGANELVLVEFDQAEHTYELNKVAAEVARAACDAHSTSDKPRFVIGSMGPGTRLITLGQASWDAMFASYREQVRGLIDGGADALIIETCQDLLQVKCAINGALDAMHAAGRDPQSLPILISVTIETTGTMLLGTSIEAAATALRQFPISSLGLNCATGPIEMGDKVRYLSRAWDRAISVIPNAGLPVLVEGRTEYPLGPKAFAESMQRFLEETGVNIVGGCCGTTPEHIRQLAATVNGRAPASRRGARAAPACTSLYAPVEYRQDASILIVGERCNASGSRKFKELLESEDTDGIISLARQQMRDGSHILDVNVDYAGRDNIADMRQIVHELSRQVDAPLMIDSTQIATVEAGLQSAAGKCIINSANFEDGEEKFDTICRLAKKYGAALVIGTIDEDKEAAMARTRERKLEIAERTHRRATEHHEMDAADLFFDPLVLPISTGMAEDRRSALETIEGTRSISRMLPECQLTCGVSNVSFGLKPAARLVLNSVFLSELTEAGMTSAIVHASKILPRNRIDDEHWTAALDLIHDRRAVSAGGTGLPDGITDESFDPLSRLIELFKDVSETKSTARPMASMTLEERLRAHIVDGEKEGLTACIDEALAAYPPLDIINDHLLDGMKTVGELFGSGQMQLPFVLQSAEVMKRAVALLEPHMDRADGQTKGTIVLATVKGDVHDIGKNLVDIILTNNGYTVHNLGIKQPIADIIKAFEQHNANAIGLSGLLVKSVNVMEDNLRELNERNITVPVILGGAALSRHYAEGHLRSVYSGQCLYGKDAFEGLSIMDLLMQDKLDDIVSGIETRQRKRRAAEETIAQSRAAKSQGDSATAVATDVRSDVSVDIKVPTAPFLGSRLVESIPLDEIYPFINTTALFKGQWQFRKGSRTAGEYQHELEDTIHPIFSRLKTRCRDEQILEPKVVYGYWQCAADGNDLVVFDPEDASREIERFSFPRQRSRRRICISDFFKSIDDEQRDIIAMHCVTVGHRVSEEARRLFDQNDYSEYLYLHGLGVETAEALAELWHKRIRQELGIASDDAPAIKDLFTQHYRGSRYSFGYPACPEMSDQEKLFRMLKPERIGCELTENWQIDPEQSTSAIVVHHPEAKYFAV